MDHREEETSKSSWPDRRSSLARDRQWAEQYQPGNIVRYTKGSKASRHQSRRICAGRGNRRKGQSGVPVRKHTGKQVTYDPRRLQGVTLYRESERSFSRGDRVQFHSASSGTRHIANRDLGTIEKIDAKGNVELRLDSGRSVAFNIKKNLHLDYGWHAVTKATAARGRPWTACW